MFRQTKPDEIARRGDRPRRVPLSEFLSGQLPRWPWFALLLLAPAIAGVIVGRQWRFPGVVLAAIVLSIWISVFIRRHRLVAANARDHEQAAAIRAEMAAALGSEIARTGDNGDSGSIGDTGTFAGLRLVDLELRVNPKIQAAIDGWLSHTLGIASEGGGPGSDSALTGRTDTGGWSLASLLASGGAIAEFLQPARPNDTVPQKLRLVVPQAWWVAECVNESARLVASPFLRGTHSHDALVASVGQAIARFPFSTDDLSSRLGAVLRAPAAGRPEFAASGVFVGPGVVLAGALRSSVATSWTVVFPFFTLRSIRRIAERHRPVYRLASIYGTRKSHVVIMDT